MTTSLVIEFPSQPDPSQREKASHPQFSLKHCVTQQPIHWSHAFPLYFTALQSHTVSDYVPIPTSGTAQLQTSIQFSLSYWEIIKQNWLSEARVQKGVALNIPFISFSKREKLWTRMSLRGDILDKVNTWSHTEKAGKTNLTKSKDNYFLDFTLWSIQHTIPSKVLPHSTRIITLWAANTFFFFFWPGPWCVEVPGPGSELVPQKWPKLLQCQHRILSPLYHKRTPIKHYFSKMTNKEMTPWRANGKASAGIQGSKLTVMAF